MIKEISENKFIDTYGNERYLFEFTPQDLEQKDKNQILAEIDYLKRDLNLLSCDNEFKVYFLGGKVYFDSFKNLSELGFFKSTPYKNGLDPFIAGENVFSTPLFKDDYCKINGQYLRFVSISLKEDHKIDVADLQNFGDYFLSFKRLKTMFSKIMVNDARKMSHSSLYDALSDIEGIEVFKENEEMLRKIITREEELFKTEVLFTISSSTENELTLKTKKLLSKLEIAGLSPRIETKSLNNCFKDYIPGNRVKQQKPLLFHTSLLVNSLPLHKDALMSKGVSFNSRSNNELLFDSRVGDSFSICITGKTGNGKTVLTNKLIDFELSQGRKVLVFDPKGDYRKHALLKNAHIIDDSINPMIFNDPIYLRNLILSKVPKEERSALWEGKLLRAIRESEAHECNNFFRALNLLRDKDFRDLEYYFEDIADKISEKKEPLSDFTYIEFSSFTEQTIPFLLSFAFEYVKRLNAPYDLIIDEAHRVFDHNPTFLEQRVREMRVQNASLIPITQKYSDLVGNYFGEVVADSCFHKIFFSQQIELEKNIDEFDIANIKSLRTKKGEFSEFYYKSDDHRKVIRYFPTLKELEVFGSDKYETKKMLRFIKENLRYFTVDECINQWVGRKYA